MKNKSNNKKNKILSILDNKKKYTVANQKICFLKPSQIPLSSAGHGFKSYLQNYLKKYGSLYSGLVKIFSPLYFNSMDVKKIEKITNKYTNKDIILNIGSGPEYFMSRHDIINLDIYPFTEVDIVADAAALPINNNCVDLIINMAFLEHVSDPEAALNEMFRILKPGGVIICSVPFIVPYHAAPDDYFRWTNSGLKKFFADFRDVKILITAGPTSAMLWVLQEWLAILFSFGNKTIHDAVFLVTMVLTAPLKLLDIFLAKHPYAKYLASVYYVIAKKQLKYE